MRKVKCKICEEEFDHITYTHLKKHNLTTKKYRQLFPSASFGIRPDMQGENSKMKLPEVRKKVSETKKKLYQDHPEIKLIGDKNPMSKPENREKHLEVVSSEKHRNNLSKKHKQLWKNPEHVIMMLKAQNQKPTKPEKELANLLNIILPNEYIYNGKFNEENITLIGGKLPDFVNINGHKKLIEFNGCYFHNCPICYPNGGRDNTINGFKESQERINYFKQYGWETLIIWEHELKNKNAVIDKILEFHDIPSKLGTKQLTIDNGVIK